ncbi:MAG: hypothetical protein AB1505_20575 [Candidatus Latescibacterota bacterium]
MTVQIQLRSFTVDEYHRMAESGILTERDRAELVEGRVVPLYVRGGGPRTVDGGVTEDP